MELSCGSRSVNRWNPFRVFMGTEALYNTILNLALVILHDQPMQTCSIAALTTHHNPRSSVSIHRNHNSKRNHNASFTSYPYSESPTRPRKAHWQWQWVRPQHARPSTDNAYCLQRQSHRSGARPQTPSTSWKVLCVPPNDLLPWWSSNGRSQLFSIFRPFAFLVPQLYDALQRSQS
jgi:hypothetical protein